VPGTSGSAAGPGRDARPAHHLLDPRTWRPAYTGVVQAIALAPTATRAEAAVLSGPAGARRWLGHGGMIVFDDGSYELLEPAASRATPASAPATPAYNRSASHPRISVSTASRSGSLRISWNRPG